jgi:WD40 repeat protein
MELGSKNSCQTIQASDSPIYTLSFNKQRSGYLASGDRSGVVKIWKLSQNYTKKNSSELSILNDISEKSFEDKN